MYIPKQFEIEDSEKIFAFIEQHSFGQLISLVNGRLFSSHIPFLLSPDRKVMYAHLAMKNPQWKELLDQELLITFAGAHGYISPSWYERSGVPTWNYQAVHMYGHCRLITEKDQAQYRINSLAQKYEQKFESPWLPEYSDGMLKAIICFEISISDIQCQFKLSQNRSGSEKVNVITRLKELEQVELAKAMETEL